ncbi:MAG: 50S ribosomal protein L30e [Candidatus Altiarchaeota archaeon]|nr:50S ribosomal protein L30e [Candidatus Altiarchaeota archaeon]
MNWKKELQVAVQEERTVLGMKRTLKALKASKGKFVVISSDCPDTKSVKYYAEMAKVPVYEFDGVGYDLGATVKKPFSVATVLVK